MDRDVVAPRRRVAEPIADHAHGHGNPEAPVLIRLPDLYPSARDDAAVARLAGIERASQPSASPMPPRKEIVSGTTDNTAKPSPKPPALCPGVAEAPASQPSTNPQLTGTSGTITPDLTGVASPSPLAGSPTVASAVSKPAGHPTQIGSKFQGSLNALAERFSLPKAIQAAERYDVGNHVFRVLLVLLLIASIYLVFERSRQDASLSQNTNSATTDDSRWEHEGERQPELASRSESAPGKRRGAAAEERESDEAPAHRVAKRTEPDRATSGDVNVPASSSTGKVPTGLSSEETAESNRNRGPQEPQTTDGTQDPWEFERATQAARMDSTPRANFSRDAAPQLPDRWQGDSSFPSTPVNYDQLPADRAGERAKPTQGIPWESSGNYPAPEQSGAGYGTAPHQEPRGEPRYSPGTYAPSGSYAPSVQNAPSAGEEYIPPYTPVTLRPRSEPQYPPAGSNYSPAPPQYPGSSYTPPTTFSPPAYSPPASTSGNASGWSTETVR